MHPPDIAAVNQRIERRERALRDRFLPRVEALVADPQQTAAPLPTVLTAVTGWPVLGYRTRHGRWFLLGRDPATGWYGMVGCRAEFSADGRPVPWERADPRWRADALRDACSSIEHGPLDDLLAYYLGHGAALNTSVGPRFGALVDLAEENRNGAVDTLLALSGAAAGLRAARADGGTVRL